MDSQKQDDNQATSQVTPKRKLAPRLLAIALIPIVIGTVVVSSLGGLFLPILPFILLLTVPVALGIWREKMWGYIGGIFLYLFSSLAILATITFASVADMFEGMGVFILFYLVPIMVVTIIVTISVVPKLWCLLRQGQAIQSTSISKETTTLRIILTVVFSLLIVGLFFIPQQLRPWYEQTQEAQREIRTQKVIAQQKENYKLPIYLPPNILDSPQKKVFKNDFNSNLQTLYPCVTGSNEGLEVIISSKNNESLESLLTVKLMTQKVEILRTEGTYYERYAYEDFKEKTKMKLLNNIIFWQDGDFQRSVSSSPPCVQSKKELIKVAESLQPSNW